jgi:hypothetical protein
MFRSLLNIIPGGRSFPPQLSFFYTEDAERRSVKKSCIRILPKFMRMQDLCTFEIRHMARCHMLNVMCRSSTRTGRALATSAPWSTTTTRPHLFKSCSSPLLALLASHSCSCSTSSLVVHPRTHAIVCHCRQGSARTIMPFYPPSVLSKHLSTL